MNWLEGLAPDVVTTVRRFPFAIVLAAIMTALGIAAANELGPLSSDDWLLWIAGFATAAVCAVAGVLFSEDRPDARPAGLLLTYALPVAVIAAFQIRDHGWFFPGTLPVAALLWLSVSPGTRIGRGETREEQQNRFWWMNSQAIATAVVAAAGFVIIFLGILAIERSLAVLFGVEAESIFYRWVLPFVGLFLTPVYWLSTLPRPGEFRAPQVEKPEFVGTTVAFLGQFVLVPLLLIYAAILLAYTVQIVVTQSLPQGTIGWMVLGFVVTGAAAWLVLHPPFMRTRGMVRLFRRWWFWLTLIPLALFAVAVFVRVDAYGLTTERVLLIAGGIWAALLAIVFLTGRGDIRLIPALAGVILLLLGIGPWNVMALPNYDQGAQLSRLLAESDPTSSVVVPDWDEAEAVQARGAIAYLNQDDHGRQVLARVLLDRGIVYDVLDRDTNALMAKLGYPQVVDPSRREFVSVPRDPGAVVDVSATPYHLRHLQAYYSTGVEAGLSLRLEDGALIVKQGSDEALRRDLTEWAGRQSSDRLTEPWIDFAVGGRNYRYVLTTANWQYNPSSSEEVRQVTNLTGELFSEQPDEVTPTP